jgi:hydroxypyruvate reductase
VTLLAAGTDGRDGPTDAAGAVVDPGTAAAIRAAGRDPADDLARHRSHHALAAAGALVATGPTGTNVADVVLALVRAP